jgi:hypothetical protein
LADMVADTFQVTLLWRAHYNGSLLQIDYTEAATTRSLT